MINPEDRFSHDEADIMMVTLSKAKLLLNISSSCNMLNSNFRYVNWGQVPMKSKTFYRCPN